MTHTYPRRGTRSGQNQSTKVLKIAADSWKSIILSSKAGAHTLLVTDRNSYHMVMKVSGTYETPLHWLTHRKEVFQCGSMLYK